MALSPKSNSAYIAVEGALADIRIGKIGKIPNHIKTTSMDYKYPHNYPNNWVEQEYLPNILKGRKYYQYKNNKYEKELSDFNKKIKEKI
jgi:putative ATPase